MRITTGHVVHGQIVLDDWTEPLRRKGRRWWWGCRKTALSIFRRKTKPN